MKHGTIICIVFLIMAASQAAFGEDKMMYIFHGPESAMDTRYDYHWEILKTALEKTAADYPPYVMEPSAYMNEDRQVSELKKASGLLTVMIRETSLDYEKIFVPVRIPIDKDLIGYRVFLIRKENQPEFSAIKSLEELKKHTIGQGKGWGDVDILRANGFEVIEGPDYEGLFKMLIKGRFDIFSRGIAEVIDEYEQRKAVLPDLHIEQTITLYYPLPTYFWFSKTPEGERLAQRVKQGMMQMIDDGTYDQIFMKYNQHVIEYHKLKGRKIFRIENPFLSPETPFNDKRLWYDPFS